jgi:hypothetical protein
LFNVAAKSSGYTNGWKLATNKLEKMYKESVVDYFETFYNILCSDSRIPAEI